MSMIDLDNSFVRVNNESSSKGNQKKFYKDGYWIKLDNEKCFEGLAEEFASVFASCIVDFPHVVYNTEVFNYNDDIYNGCYSQNMLTPVTEFISLKRLLRQNNIPLNIFLVNNDATEPIERVVNEILNITGINIFSYLNRLLFFDTLIINEDRHYMNLGVCKTEGIFSEAPCFDNGSSLFCVNWSYRKKKSLDENLASIKSAARPFSKFYDVTNNALLKLGAKPLYIKYNCLKDVLNNYHNNIYSVEQQELIKNVLIKNLDYYRDKGIYVYV